MKTNDKKKITPTGFWECDDPTQYKQDWQLASMLTTVLRDKTVLDLGCGNGYYTNYLRDHGVKAWGYDGNPHTREIAGGFCDTADLSQPQDFGQFDWVLCLEVAEHIPKQYESVLVDNLKKHARIGIILSWAIPGQGGHGHVNEQKNSYVLNLFSEYQHFIGLQNQLREVATLKWFKKSLMVFRK